MLFIYKPVLITSPTGFDTAFTNVEPTLKQRDNVVSTFFQHCSNVGQRLCINVVLRWKSDIEFCFIFKVGWTLFQRSLATLKQRWSDVEMLAGLLHRTINTGIIKLDISDHFPIFFYSWNRKGNNTEGKSTNYEMFNKQ